MTAHSGSNLEVTVREPSLLSSYGFGTNTAEFQVCAQCGVMPVVTSTIDNHVYAVVNVNTFQNVDPSLIHRAPADFEGEEVETRLARRTRNWIGNVRFSIEAE